jgi:hypothetical protein
MPDIAAGWYLDPENATLMRWWNGVSWSDQRQPIPAAATQVAPAYSPQPTYAPPAYVPPVGYGQQPPAAVPPGSTPPTGYYVEPGFTMQYEPVKDQKGFFGNPYKLEGDLKSGRNRAAIWGLVVAILGAWGIWILAAIGLYLGILGLLRSRITDKGKNLSIVTISIGGFGILVAVFWRVLSTALGL